MMILSSSGVKGTLHRPGSSCCDQRSRHDLPLRPGSRAAIADQRHAPNFLTRARSCSSSAGVQKVIRPVFFGGGASGLLAIPSPSSDPDPPWDASISAPGGAGAAGSSISAPDSPFFGALPSSPVDCAPFALSSLRPGCLQSCFCTGFSSLPAARRFDTLVEEGGARHHTLPGPLDWPARITSHSLYPSTPTTRSPSAWLTALARGGPTGHVGRG
mmetsp:Transcript_44241/g.99957  ORF Transcript_44241/g.99957 Transcript_44241/m.99957 type:complete len:215 (-) Transcript_44241:308-952(-)